MPQIEDWKTIQMVSEWGYEHVYICPHCKSMVWNKEEHQAFHDSLKQVILDK